MANDMLGKELKVKDKVAYIDTNSFGDKLGMTYGTIISIGKTKVTLDNRDYPCSRKQFRAFDAVVKIPKNSKRGGHSV